MPRKQSKVPAYCLHKASGQAVVRLSGKDRYLGPHGTPESFERYERAISEWRAGQLSSQPAGFAASSAAHSLTINALLLCYLKFAETYYVDESGQTTGELNHMKYALRPVRKLFGRTLVRDFGPRALKTVRQSMIDEGLLSRGVINKRINRVRRLFKWAVSEELAPPSVHEGLRTVSPLHYGRTTAREAPPVKPVPPEYVASVLEVVSPQIGAMIQLQQLAAMRPSEVVKMRQCDIDRSCDIWIYRPEHHKNRWRDHERQIFLGPRAQDLIRPFLERGPDVYLFSPREAERWRQLKRRQQRQTPMTPSQSRRKPQSRPGRAKRDRYDRHSYGRAITYAVARVNRQRKEAELPEIPHWFPLQLRHSRATEIRRTHGLEGSQIMLGHKRADVTEVYAERDLDVGLRIAREVG